MRRALKQAWELNVAEKAERLIRNLARRFAQGAPDVSRSTLEGRDGILTRRCRRLQPSGNFILRR